MANLSVASPNRFLSSFLHANGIVVKLYPAVGITPSAIIRADGVHVDHQKRGFFRIGVLPMLALERFSLEVCNTNEFLTALANASTRLGSGDKAADVVEGRDFSLSFTGQTQGVLHSKTIRLGDPEEWFLQNGTINQPGADPIPFNRAALTIAGPKAGQLVFQTASGLQRIYLVSLYRHAEYEPTKP